MASSRVTSPPSIFSPPIAEMQSPIPLDSPGKALGSMNMEDLLRNIYTDDGGGGVGVGVVGAIGGGSRPDVSSGKTVDEVWREISSGKPARADVSTAGGGGAAAVPGGGGGGEMTLEDFLAREDEGKPRVRVLSGLLGSVSAIPGDGSSGNGHSATGRGRKRQILDPIDRAAMQRQKRMIKNRESAARSRERKQAYVAELESLVSQLEEENAQLLRYQEEQHQRRLKQLMENLIPVTIGKRPKRQLRRTNSMEW